MTSDQTTGEFLLVHPLLGADGLGEILPWLPARSDVIPAAPGPIVDFNIWDRHAVDWATEQGRTWQTVVGLQEGAAAAAEIARRGLARRLILIDLSPDATQFTPDELERLATRWASNPAPPPEATDTWTSPRIAAVLAATDGTDPARQEYADRIRRSMIARDLVDGGAMTPNPEAANQGLDLKLLSADFPTPWVALFSREFRTMGEVLRDRGLAGIQFPDVCDIEWLTDPERLAAMVRQADAGLGARA